MKRNWIGMIGSMLLAGSAAAVEVADYRFQDSYASSVGSAPALAPNLPGQSFSTESLNGVARRVLNFPIGAGVELSTAGLIANNQYSIAMLVRIEDSVGYIKCIDVSNGAVEEGLYVHNGRLEYYPIPTSSPIAPIGSGSYHQIVLTRSTAGVLSGYVDGRLMFSDQDAEDISLIDAGANRIRFMIDDEITLAEESAGSLARLRIWNHVLTPAEVAALEVVNPGVFKDGFEE